MLYVVDVVNVIAGCRTTSLLSARENSKIFVIINKYKKQRPPQMRRSLFFVLIHKCIINHIWPMFVPFNLV